MLFRFRWAMVSIGSALLLIGVIMLIVWLMPPRDFPRNTILTIPPGTSAEDFGHILAGEHMIRSPLLFKILARVTGYDHHLDTGAYVFSKPLSLPHVVTRIGKAEHGISAMRITLTEGMSRFSEADALSKQLPGFNSAEFLEESSTSEGYLFPETYLLMPGTPSKEIVVELKSQFSQSVATITPQILSSSHSFADAVTMASILEREAKTPEDMRIVSGILWNRIARGMPLQVDAAFAYEHQQDGYVPTSRDIATDSPYNTYMNRGLPPTPISNPGIVALLAALTPAKTSYVYYLTGTDGKMHYAVTYDEHKKNIATYLK